MMHVLKHFPHSFVISGQCARNENSITGEGNKHK